MTHPKTKIIPIPVSKKEAMLINILFKDKDKDRYKDIDEEKDRMLVQRIDHHLIF